MPFLRKIIYGRDYKGGRTISRERRAVTTERRNTLRETVCVGCRHNYYNWPREYSMRGVAVAEDEGCWHLEGVDLRNKKIPCYSKNRG